MNPFVVAFSVLGFIVLIGLFIVLFDKGLRWKGKS
jgi:preprotein translocase subunit SecE